MALSLSTKPRCLQDDCAGDAGDRGPRGVYAEVNRGTQMAPCRLGTSFM